VLNCISKFYQHKDVAGAAIKLAEMARNFWKSASDKIDDISVIVAFIYKCE